MPNYNWKPGFYGDWGTSGNWVQGAVPNGTLANVTIAAGSRVVIFPEATFTADSVTLDSVGVTLDVDGVLNLGGSRDQILVNGGSLYVHGANQYRGTPAGTIANGTINAGTGTINVGYAATLADITFKGSIYFTGYSNYLGLSNETIDGYIRALDSTGSTIDVAGYSRNLYIRQTQSLNDLSINLGGKNGFGDGISFGILTFSSGTTLNSYCTPYDRYVYNFLLGTNIVNDGVINVTGAGGAGLGVDVSTFTNAGTINVAAGTHLKINSSYFQGSAGGIRAAGTVDLSVDSLSLTNLEGITLVGAGLLNIGGSLNLGGALLMAPGVDNIEITGTVSNGRINTSLETLSFGYGTLDNMTILGNLNVANGAVEIMGTLDVENASGNAPGTINIDGSLGRLIADGNATVDNVGINLGDGAAFSGSGNLTLGSHATVNTLDFNQFRGGYVFSGGSSSIAGYIVNDGTVNVLTGGRLEIVTATFRNAGIINVAAEARLVLGAGSFSNIGKINAAGEIELEDAYPYGFDGSTTLANLGEISLTGDGLLFVDSPVSLDLGGGTLRVGGTDNIEIAGTVGNGTINPSLGTLSLSSGATLSDITWEGNLNLTRSSFALNIIDGLTVESAGGGAGTINVIGLHDRLDFTHTAKLDDLVINLGTVGQPSNDHLNSGSGAPLTLGSQAVVNSNGKVPDFLFGHAIVNAGAINVAGFGLDIRTTTFTNAGTISVGAGSKLAFDSVTTTNSGLVEATGTGTASISFEYGGVFTNLSGTKLTGGGFEANPHDTLALNLNGAVITTDDGLLILNGTGSEIEEYQSASSSYLSLESTLETIGNGGTLKVTGGRGYSTGNTLDINGGKLSLSGGTFSAALLDLTKQSSHFIGDGTIDGTIVNAGAINANGGTLVIDGPLSGAGVLVIDRSATLKLATGTSENVTFTGTGGLHSALILEDPTLYTGTLSGIEAGDSIVLAGEMASSASIIGTSLLVTLTSHAVLDYTLASALPMEGVSISSVGTGSELIFYQLPAAPAASAIRFMAPPVTTATRAPSVSLPALPDLWSGAANYHPSFVTHSGQASFTNPQNLQTELGNMPTPTNAGIVVPGQLNWELARRPYHDLALAAPKG